MWDVHRTRRTALTIIKSHSHSSINGMKLTILIERDGDGRSAATVLRSFPKNWQLKWNEVYSHVNFIFSTILRFECSHLNCNKSQQNKGRKVEMRKTRSGRCAVNARDRVCVRETREQRRKWTFKRDACANIVTKRSSNFEQFACTTSNRCPKKN